MEYPASWHEKRLARANATVSAARPFQLKVLPITILVEVISFPVIVATPLVTKEHQTWTRHASISDREPLMVRLATQIRSGQRGTASHATPAGSSRDGSRYDPTGI